MGQKWVKNAFFHNYPSPLGMLKQLFLAPFEPLVTRFGPWKIPKCLENWPLWDQESVKNGSKTHSSQPHPGPFRVFKQVFLARFSPRWRLSAYTKSQNAVKMGRFGTKSGSKLGQKSVFPKVILDYLVAPTSVFDRFEPCGDVFWPMENPKMP